MSRNGGSEPLPRLRRQSGAGQDFSSFIFLHTYIFSVRSDQIIFTQSYPFGASKGLLPQEADDTSRHVEADEAMGPPSQPRGGWRGASQEASGAGRPCASFSPTSSSREVCTTSRLHSSKVGMFQLSQPPAFISRQSSRRLGLSWLSRHESYRDRAPARHLRGSIAARAQAFNPRA